MSTPEDIAKYTFPNETVVDMNEAKLITVQNGDHKKTISTFGLGGCLALVFYARQNDRQIAYLSHDALFNVDSWANLRALQAIDEMHKLTQKPEVIDIFIISPGEYGKNYEFIPKPKYRGLNTQLSAMLSHQFPQAKISAEFAPYSSIKYPNEKTFYQGGRDVIVELDPDYKASSFLTKYSYRKILRKFK